MPDTLMPETPFRAELRATLIGPLAARALCDGARGSVAALFDRSFYVSLQHGWVCVGPRTLGAGPLNVLCGPWPLTEHAGGRVVLPGDPVHVENGTLRARNLVLSLAEAQVWHPDAPGAWDSTSLARGLAAFADALPAELPADGLARLMRPSDSSDPSTHVLAAAQAPARYLAELLARRRWRARAYHRCRTDRAADRPRPRPHAVGRRLPRRPARRARAYRPDRAARSIVERARAASRGPHRRHQPRPPRCRRARLRQRRPA